ncbi:cytochrome c biogenesis CcdA family protein [Leucobacter sp. W1478]|uniref:cytochrome c biogenesis CcdA family protein n=1 Tax=Leucobacter sp. W1478 TaxID=3439065 RepID=UPI003F2E31D9
MIQEVVADGQLLIAASIALLAGIISFASPCVLPLVPGYLAYVGGVSGVDAGTRASRRRVVLGVVLFIAGFSAVFVAMMALAGSVGLWLVEWEGLITRIMGVLVIAMGLGFIGMFEVMQRTMRMKVKPRGGLLGAPLLGVVFAIGWTPCLGPTLTTIMALSLQQGSVSRSVVLALFYCAGLGLPFILVAFGFGWVTGVTKFVQQHIRIVNLTGGILMILIGVLMVSGLWTKMMYALQAVIGGYVTPL